jgi:hypothetical protein
MKKLSYIFLSLILVLGFSACEYTDIVEDDGSSIEISDNLSFSKDIEPIFRAQSCTNCHPSMKKPDLNTGKAFNSLMDGGFVNTSDPEKSSILTKPAPDGNHAGKYTSVQSRLILEWIRQGAKNN